MTHGYDNVGADIAAQIAKLQLALKIKRAVMLLDKEPPKDTDINFDPFKSTSTSDVLNFIDRRMEQIDKDVIFLLSRHTLAELEKQRNDLKKEESDKARDRVNVRHKKALSIPGVGIYKTTAEKHADAAKQARDLWATQKDLGKTKKWVYATIAERFDVSAGAIRTWVSANGKIE